MRAATSRLFPGVAAAALLTVFPGCGVSLLVGGIIATNDDGDTVTVFPPAPQVTSIFPTSASHGGGDVLRLEGENFTADTQVTINGLNTPRIDRISSTLILAEVPRINLPDGSQVDVVVASPIAGSSTVSNGLTLTNTAPEVEFDEIEPSRAGLIVFSISVRDFESDPTDVLLEAGSVTSGTFAPITSQILSGSASNLETDREFSAVSLAWDSTFIFPAQISSDVVIRATPIDSLNALGTAVTSDPFAIDNRNVSSATRQVLAPAPLSRVTIQLGLEVRDLAISEEGLLAADPRLVAGVPLQGGGALAGIAGALSASSQATLLSGVPSDYHPAFVAQLDVDRDGQPDVVFADEDERLLSLPLGQALELNALNGAQEQSRTPLGAVRQLAAGDLDGDGWAELVALSAEAQVYGSSPAGLVATQTLSLGSDPAQLVLAELDGRLGDELAVIDRQEGSLRVYRDALGAPTQARFDLAELLGELPLPAGDLRALAAGDLDGDGTAELALVLGQTRRVLLLDLSRELTLSKLTSLEVPGAAPARPALVDVSYDGQPDLLLPLEGEASLLVYVSEPLAPNGWLAPARWRTLAEPWGVIPHGDGVLVPSARAQAVELLQVR